jgi:hypothetical protein
LIDIEYAITVDVEATPAWTYDEVNRIPAQAIGLKFSEAFLLRADEVIE